MPGKSEGLRFLPLCQQAGAGAGRRRRARRLPVASGQVNGVARGFTPGGNEKAPWRSSGAAVRDRILIGGYKYSEDVKPV
ncbi:hypothetical protein ABZZ16_18055, partial [Streptomyces sp. NPDC006386]|uniref:hypothetical protein n=1 Tax=Streptomyces sp. NPDC006386 TaxID=3156762 RepID=UPI0033B27269